MGKLSFGTTGHAYQPSEVKLQVGGAPICPRCSQRVYFNEEKRALGKVWHSKCFQCAKCKKSLDSTNCAGHENEIYCATCHKREFGPRGYGFAGGMAGLSTESTSNNVRSVSPVQTTAVPAHIPNTQKVDTAHPDCCPRCGKKVFFAEEVKALRRKWHRLCLKCDTCNKLLEPGRCSEHEGGVYCSGCYGRLYGPSGYGFAGGAGSLLSSDPLKNTLRRGGSPGSSRGSSPARALDGSRGGSPVTTQNGSRGQSPLTTSAQTAARAQGPVAPPLMQQTEEYVPIPTASQNGNRGHSPLPTQSMNMKDVERSLPEPTYNGNRRHSPVLQNGSRDASPVPQITVTDREDTYEINPVSAQAALRQCGIDPYRYQEEAPMPAAMKSPNGQATYSYSANQEVPFSSYNGAHDRQASDPIGSTFDPSYLAHRAQPVPVGQPDTYNTDIQASDPIGSTFDPSYLAHRAQPVPVGQPDTYTTDIPSFAGEPMYKSLPAQQDIRPYSPTMNHRYSPEEAHSYGPEVTSQRDPEYRPYSPNRRYSPEMTPKYTPDVTSIRDPEIERSYSPEMTHSGSSSPYSSLSHKQASNTIFRALERKLQASPIGSENGRSSPMDRAMPAPVNDEGYNSGYNRSPARADDWTDPVYL